MRQGGQDDAGPLLERYSRRVTRFKEEGSRGGHGRARRHAACTEAAWARDWALTNPGGRSTATPTAACHAPLGLEPSLPVSDFIFPPGTILADRFRVVRHVGSGGMGSVYEVEHIHIGVRRALKILLEPSGSRSPGTDRFLRGARNAAGIDHPNVCRVYDFGSLEGGQKYLLMEFVPGRSLDEALLSEGRFSLRQSLVVARSIARALDAAHARGVIHRDLKPHNVMLGDESGDGAGIRVVDFDIARKMGDLQGPELTITGTGFAVGTPEYMSPEQVTGQPLDGRSDLYSLGLILYRMVSGTLPFSGANSQEVMTSRLVRPPAAITESAPELQVPQSVLDLLQGLLALKPEQRPSTAGDVAQVLEAIIDELDGGDEPGHHDGEGDSGSSPQRDGTIPGSDSGEMVRPTGIPTGGLPVDSAEKTEAPNISSVSVFPRVPDQPSQSAGASLSKPRTRKGLVITIFGVTSGLVALAAILITGTGALSPGGNSTGDPSGGVDPGQPGVSAGEWQDDSSDGMTERLFFLDPNGVTVRCPEAEIGAQGEVNGVMYTRRARDQITPNNAETTCTSGITEMSRLFADQDDFNGDLGSWDVSAVTNMMEMFYYSRSFDQDIGAWDVSQVTNMSSMFEGAWSFDFDISEWDVSSVQNMASMFDGAVRFDKDISTWNVRQVRDMDFMFRAATSFNRDLSGWCVDAISSPPRGFDTDANAWSLPQPSWGTCPGG